MITICVIFTTTVASPLSTMAEAPEGLPAEETAAVTEQAAAEAEPATVGQAPAPAAEAPAAEAPPPAPVPAPETSAPAPETSAPAPQTAAPASVPETSAPKVETPAAESQTAAPAAEPQTSAPAAEKQPEETQMADSKEEKPSADGKGSGKAGDGHSTTAEGTDAQNTRGGNAPADQADAGSAAGDASTDPPQTADAQQAEVNTTAATVGESDTAGQQPSGQPEAETGKETESESETETETEETYPAQSFTGRANNITVSVIAGEGVFPKGTTMVTTAVSAQHAISIANAATDDQTEVKDAIGVDISFRDASGREIEPKDGRSVQVRMTIGAGSALEGDNFSVVHQKDNGAVETVTENASARGAVFAADSFSIYVITGTGTAEQGPAVETWNFYGADNTTLLSTQMVKDGESLNAPASPEKDGFIFRGWAYSAEKAAAGAAGAVDVAAFTTRTVEVSSTRTVNLYPVFEAKLYVFFMDSYERVWQTKEGASGDTISVSDVTLPLGSEQSVTGWYTDSMLSGSAVTEVTLEREDVTLYPKVESGHYLYFSSGEGASYVAPQFVAANSATVKPGEPTRSGYTFAGWSSAKGSAEADFTFGGKLTENKTIYAVWEARPDTKYTVIFWKQSVNDNKNASDSQKTYDYAESVTRTGTSGKTASPEYQDKNKNYTGFQYNGLKSVPVTINGDGTTILNVYYDRKTLTINFKTLDRGWWKDYKTFTGLYGQTLAQNGYTWPFEDKDKTHKYRWEDEKNIEWTFLDAFIFDDNETKLTLYGSDSEGKISINHYKQNLDGTYSYSRPTNSTYSGTGTFYFTNKYNGFEIDSYYIGRNTPTDDSVWSNASAGNSVKYRSNLYIRYTRNKYDLSFYNYNGESRKESVLYEASLESYASYVPDRPSGLSMEFTFQGWYKDPECTQAFDFSQTMPAGGVTLYAKWAEPTYNATIHLTMDGSGASNSLTIGYGAAISESDMPTVKNANGNTVFQGNGSNTVMLPENVDWIGWAMKNGTQYTTFNFATKIYRDITLYPYYVNKKKYSVTYEANGGTGTVTDAKTYASGAWADIQSGERLKAPDGKTAFLYWSANADGTGLTYYPGDRVQVTGDLILHAVYGDPSKTTSLTYNSNYPSGTDEQTKKQSINGSETLQNNVSFQALSPADVGFSVPDGYYFAGWNTGKNGSGTAVAAGADILVDVKVGPNTLYAQWVKKQAVVLKVKGRTETHTYDGKKHDVNGYTTYITVDEKEAAALPGKLKLDETKAKNKAATGTDAGAYKIGLMKDDFSITGSDLEKYSITIKVTDGTLTVEPRSVTLTSASDSKAFDGTALTAPVVTVSGDGFVAGETSDIKATGTITRVGSVTNTIIYTEAAGFDERNYSIAKQEGTLTITKNQSKITITAASDSKSYDGTPLTNGGYKVEGLPEGFTLADVTVTGSATNVSDTSSGNNKVTGGKILCSGEDVTGQFANIERVDGTLTILKRKVTLTSATDSKEYDGKPLTNSTVTGGDGFVAGEVKELKATGSQTDVGSSANPISYSTEGTAFQAGNYEIEEIIGTLTVTKNGTELVVTAPSRTWKYDGTEHSTGNTVTTTWPASATDYAAKYTVTATVSGSVKDVDDGEVANVVAPESIKIIEKSSGRDVTANFDPSKIKVVDGTLQILPRKVTLTSESASKPFDGTPLTKPVVKITEDGFVTGEVTDVRATGTITRSGSVPNTITYQKGEKFKEKNYVITVNTGTLTVTKANVGLVITAPSRAWEYDGTAHSTGDNVTVRWLSEWYESRYKVEATVEGSVKNVAEGDVENKVKSYVIKNNAGADVTDLFSKSQIQTVSGTLKVTPRDVELKSESKTKPYDGTPLTAPGVTVVSEKSFVGGEVTDIRATGSALTTDDGIVPNTITWTAGKTFDETNYTIRRETGTLQITQNQTEITVTAASGSKVYDGTALTKGESTTVGLPEGFTAEVKVEGTATNVADSKAGNNRIQSVRILKDGQDVTSQFARITKLDGKLAIEKRQVFLASESASRPYDGTPLTRPAVKVTGQGFVSGEIKEDSIRADGSITNVGEVTNSILYTPEPKGGFDENNYEIQKKEGTLSISKAEVAFRVKAASHTWTYDGKVHSDTGYTVTVPDKDQEVYGAFEIGATVKGSVTDVTEKQVANEVTAVAVKLDGKDVTDQFDTGEMSLENGILEISPAEVMLTSDSGSKEYDGTPLEKPEVTVKGTIVETGGKPQIFQIRATGSVTDVTTDPVPNTIAYDTTEDFIPENYVITKEEGTLSVMKNTSAEVIFMADSAQKIYDGTPLTAPGVKVTGLPDGFTTEGRADGSITSVMQTKAGNNPVTAVKILDKNGKDVTAWFTVITKKAGTLTITQRELTLTSASASKPYDGKPLKKEEVMISGADGLAENHTISYSFTGSQTYVGTSENIFTYTILEKERSTIQTTYGAGADEEIGSLLTLQLNAQAVPEDGSLNGPFTPESNYRIKTEFGDLTVTDDTDSKNVVTKTHDGKAYRLGEQIVFTIKVTNIYDSVQTITLTEQSDVVFTGKQTFEGVKPGETVTTSAYHVVTEADIAVGSYSNTVTAAFKGADKPWEGTDEEYQFAHLTLKKTVTSKPGNGKAYVKGETIRYLITAVNDGTVTLTDLNIQDRLTEDKWQVEKLDPKEEVSFETSYVVAEKDVEKGFVENEAVGNAKRPGTNENDVIPTPPTVQVPVEASDSSLYVEKTSDVGEGTLVTAGDVIHYTIKVLNNGNTVLSDVTVTDELTGDSWKIEGDLKPGEFRTFEASYTVTEKDMLAGIVKNTATADGRDPGGDKPDVTPGSTGDKTIEGTPHLTVTKKATSLPKDTRGYTLGEEIHYHIEVVNDGNVTIAAVEVSDALTGDLWKIGSLTPGESRSFDTVYAVKETDITAGKVTNVATAGGEDPAGNKPDVTPGEAVDITAPGEPNEGQVKGITKPEETENPETEAPKQNGVVKAEVKKPSGTQQTITSESQSAAKTGDSAQTELYLILLLIAAGGIGLIAWRRKDDKDGSI